MKAFNKSLVVTFLSCGLLLNASLSQAKADKKDAAPQENAAGNSDNKISTKEGKGSIELTWDANKQKDIAGYRLYYGHKSGKYTEKVDVGNKTTYKVNGLEIGKTLYFSVTAYDKKGNESTYAKEIVVKVKK